MVGYISGKNTIPIIPEWSKVEPAYSTYQLKGKLIPIESTSETIDFEIEDSGNRNWIPEEIVTEKYKLSLPEKPKGEYSFAIQLFDKTSGKPVDLGLTIEMKKDEFFIMQNLTF